MAESFKGAGLRLRSATEDSSPRRLFKRVTVGAVAACALLAPAMVEASGVDVSVVDVTAPTGSVALAPGGSGTITINMTVTGRQEGTATFEVNRNWQLSDNHFTGSNPQEFTVPPRPQGAQPTTFSTTGTVTVPAGQTAGTFTLTIGAFDITNTNGTGAKLAAGDSSNYSVTVTAPTAVAPTVSHVVTPPNGLNGWYKSGPIGIDWTVTGTPSPTMSGCGDVTIEADQAKTDYTCTATNGAGSDSETVEDIGLDSTPPTLTWDGGPTDGGSYYDFEVPAAPTCTADDTLSGPDGCTVTGYEAAVGPHAVSATAYDKAGNETTETRTYTVLESIPAGVDVIVDPSTPNGLNGWYKSGPITIDWTVTGAPAPTTSHCDDVTIEADQAKTDYTCTATNHGGTDSGTVTVGLDSKAPTVMWDGGPTNGGSYYFGSVPAASTCTADDAVSGPDGCTVTGYNAAVGTHTISATAHDQAGNVTTEARTYTVMPWTLKGFYQPVDMGSNTWNTVKGGATVPLKFEAFVSSTELTDTAAIDRFGATPVPCPNGTFIADPIEVTSTGGTNLRYDSTSGQFIQNWQTPKKPGACYTLTIYTDDGSSISAKFQLK